MNVWLRARRARLSDCRGQATIEAAVVFPVALVLMVVAFNLLNYLGICASFDRAFPQYVRSYAAAPAFGSNMGDAATDIQAALMQRFEAEDVQVRVSVSGDGRGNSVFQGSLEYAPSLFGLNFRSILFGVQIPPLRHETALALSRYRPGVIA